MLYGAVQFATTLATAIKKHEYHNGKGAVQSTNVVVGSKSVQKTHCTQKTQPSCAKYCSRKKAAAASFLRMVRSSE